MSEDKDSTWWNAIADYSRMNDELFGFRFMLKIYRDNPNLSLSNDMEKAVNVYFPSNETIKWFVTNYLNYSDDLSLAVELFQNRNDEEKKIVFARNHILTDIDWSGGIATSITGAKFDWGPVQIDGVPILGDKTGGINGVLFTTIDGILMAPGEKDNYQPREEKLQKR